MIALTNQITYTFSSKGLSECYYNTSQSDSVLKLLPVAVEKNPKFVWGGENQKGPESGNIPVVHYAPTQRPIVALDNEGINHLELMGPEAKISKFCSFFLIIKSLNAACGHVIS